VYTFDAMATQLLPAVRQILQITGELQSASIETGDNVLKLVLPNIKNDAQLTLLMLTDPKHYHDTLWGKYATEQEYIDYRFVDATEWIGIIRHDAQVWLSRIRLCCELLLDVRDYFGEQHETLLTKIIAIESLAANMRETIENVYDGLSKREH
jgi:hypothetical protein